MSDTESRAHSFLATSFSSATEVLAWMLMAWQPGFHTLELNLKFWPARGSVTLDSILPNETSAKVVSVEAEAKQAQKW